MDIPNNFIGFIGEPRCELEVVFLTGLLIEYLPFELIAAEIKGSFPDCKAIDRETRKKFGVEFEHKSSNYLDHGHPLEGCEYIICWEDDWPNPPQKITIISLKKLLKNNPKIKERFIWIQNSDSLMDRLEKLKESDMGKYQIIHYLKNAIDNLCEDYNGIYLKPESYFDLKAPKMNGGTEGFFWFNLDGRINCNNEGHFLNKYKNIDKQVFQNFRNKVTMIGIVTSIDKANSIIASLKELLDSKFWE